MLRATVPQRKELSIDFYIVETKHIVLVIAVSSFFKTNQNRILDKFAHRITQGVDSCGVADLRFLAVVFVFAVGDMFRTGGE